MIWHINNYASIENSVSNYFSTQIFIKVVLLEQLSPMLQVYGIDFFFFTESEAKKLTPFQRRKVSFSFMMGLANCRFHCIHTQSFSLPVSQLTASSVATLFSIRLYKNRSDYRALELDEGVFRFFIFLRLRKETSCMLETCSPILPDSLCNIFLPFI